MDTVDRLVAWRGLCRLAGWAALGSVALLVVQVVLLALWPVSRSAVTVVVVLGTVQMAACTASNPAVEMLALAQRDAATTDHDLHLVHRAAGEALLSSWKGTAYLVYYGLGAVVLLTLAVLIRRSPSFSTATWWWALAAGVLMVVPATFGVVGMVFALASRVPWSILCVLVGRRLLRLRDSTDDPSDSTSAAHRVTVGGGRSRH